MTRSLLWKIVGINSLTIGFVIVIIWMSVDYLAAGYFAALMEKYNIPTASSHQMFIAAVHRYLLWATVAALLLALSLGFLLTKRVLGPLTDMTTISRKIASGDYTDTVPVKSRDEVGQLAVSFNQMTASLRKMDMLRKNMVVDVAHELRTPLTNIQGYLEALVDGVLTPSAETFHLLQEETLRLAKLVEDLLRLAQADAAKTDLHKTAAYIDDLVKQALQSFSREFTAKSIQLETSFAEQKEPPLSLDQTKISQVISNLLHNALRYTPSGGTVSIHTTYSDKQVQTVFSNTGGELSEEDLPFIFERFFRGEKSRSRDRGGAGIGLAIVKELVEAHNGHVGAEISEGETRIWFSLPI
jgi:two-component system, OmpR family, sensor histidine kinase BaeS